MAVSAVSTQLQGVNLYLIGMMGAGKTTTGKALAQALGYRFFDTDALVEQTTGLTVSDIFAQAGEATFRQLETQVLAELSSYHHLVIATGGGIVLNPMNWSYLRHGLVIWLHVPVDVLEHRLRQDATRPLLAGTPLGERLSDLWQQRQALYAQADLELQIADHETAPEVSQRLLATLPQILRSATTDAQQAEKSG